MGRVAWRSTKWQQIAQKVFFPMIVMYPSFAFAKSSLKRRQIPDMCGRCVGTGQEQTREGSVRSHPAQKTVLPVCWMGLAHSIG